MDKLLMFLSKGVRHMLMQINIDIDKLQEIRIRVNCPLIIIYNNIECIVDIENGLLGGFSPYIVDITDVRETMEFVSNYSMYAYEDDIRQGFITVQGGHRIGFAGKIICENNVIKTIKNISFINVRISHQVKGCADTIMNEIINGDEVLHTLLVSPPRRGKTTLLRDIVRQISSGASNISPHNVVVIDERSEIAACYQGIPQNDVGIRTDVLDCCPKVKGMMMAVRTMAPEVIAIDELGSEQDIEAVKYAINCGCKIIATAHGNSIEDIPYADIFEKVITIE